MHIVAHGILDHRAEVDRLSLAHDNDSTDVEDRHCCIDASHSLTGLYCEPRLTQQPSQLDGRNTMP
jgi:hypothetical protein